MEILIQKNMFNKNLKIKKFDFLLSSILLYCNVSFWPNAKLKFAVKIRLYLIHTSNPSEYLEKIISNL